MRGYLLDNNHVWAHFRNEPSVIKKIRSIPIDWQMRTCNITLGEIEAGHGMNPPLDLAAEQVREDFGKFLLDNFLSTSLKVSVTTRIYYGKIMAEIWRLHTPPSKKIRTEEWLLRLGVDINDVWAEAVGVEVQFDCWIEAKKD